MAAAEVLRSPEFITPSQSQQSTRSRKRWPVNLAGSPSANCNSLLNENDDEQERKQRRRSIHLTTNILSPNAGNTTPRSRISEGGDRSNAFGNSSNNVMSNNQLKDHYTNCIKLSSENKINAKNAFGLHLIDYMKELLNEAQKDDQTTNFQVASCTLDAGVKIYAGRVDSVHSDAYKMLGSLGRASVQDPVNDEEGGDVENDKGKEKKKKTHRGSGKTIETNLKNINCDKFDLAFEVDPFFHKMSASFDEGGTAGLLLNNLLIDENCKLLLDSRSIPHLVKEPPLAILEEHPAVVDLTPFRDMYSKICNGNLEICPQFSNFCFTEWDNNAENLLFDSHHDVSLDQNQNHRFDVNASVPEPEQDVGMDDYGGVFSDESDYVAGHDDVPANSEFPDGSVDALMFADGREAQMIHPGESRNTFGGSSGTLCLELSLQPSEYSYFKHDILETWAGPQHWKLKPRATVDKFGTQANAEPRKRDHKKAAFRIDFDAIVDFETYFSIGKALTTLAKSTLDKMTSQATTLPEDLHYDSDNLFRLFIKKSIKVTRQLKATELNDQDGEWYNYDNPNDRENFCPDLQDDDGYDADVGGDIGCDEGDIGGDIGTTDPIDMTRFDGDVTRFDATHFNETVGLDQTIFTGDQLVSQPNRVKRIEISYAKAAKRIDIKKLKRCMWEVLTKDDKQANKDLSKENIPENTPNPNQIPIKPLDERIIKSTQSFSELFKILPTMVSKHTAKELSVPIAFFCLLYLANEKFLKLEGREDASDFLINQVIEKS